MFERRVKWFSIILGCMALVIAVRLVDLQVVRADEFQAQAARMLTRPVQYLRAPRGAILDRHGTPLLRDVPAWDVCVHFGVIAGRQDYLRAVARELRARGAYPPKRPIAEIADELRLDIARMWQRLAELTGRPVAEFIERGQQLRSRVERIRDAVERRSGIVQPVAEEYQLHPLLEGIDDQLALQLRIELEQYPWLRVVAGSRRVATDADAFAHLLGRLGHVDRERLERDPLRHDELRQLRAGELCGVSGVEAAADTALRGTRGRRVEDFDRHEIERVDALQGADVRLTIDAELQRRVYALLADAISRSVHPSGGSAVVIDAASREVLALVSYPAFAYDRFSEEYDRLRRDTRDLPLLFRAVAGQYPPGSTCKAVTLVAALSEQVVGEHTRIHCTGYLDRPDAFRCWIYNQFPGVTHDMDGHPEGQDASDAVRNSCNIYFYRAGERLGPQRLCDWFRRFGFGRTAGTRLPEEVAGIVPDEAYLRRAQGRGFDRADPWNWAIGQGEVTITPLQAANVAASIAAGRWEPVRLFRDEVAESRPSAASAATALDGDALRILRAGMWRVVNERGGTGADGRLADRRFDFCGKTGSAQAAPRAVSYTYTLEGPDGRRETVVASSKDDALAAYAAPRPKVVGWRAAERFPQLLPGEKLPSHAWFIGYTQAAGNPRGSVPQAPVYAIAVVIEYGGSGGKVAAPLARAIAELLLPAN